MLHRKYTTHFTIGLHLEDNFCLTLHRPTPIVLSPMEKNGRVGQDIWKGVYYALVLTFWNFATFKCLSKTKQRRCPVGVLYTYLKCRIAISVSILMVTNGIEVVLYISAWGFCVARFDRMGNSQEPLIVKRATVQGFTLFCVWTEIRINIMVIWSPISNLLNVGTVWSW